MKGVNVIQKRNSFCLHLISNSNFSFSMGLRFHLCLVFSLCFVIYIVVAWSLSHIHLFRKPMDCSPPNSSVHGISQVRIQEWFPFPSPGDLPDPGIEPSSPASQADSLPLSHQGSPSNLHRHHIILLVLTTTYERKK